MKIIESKNNSLIKEIKKLKEKKHRKKKNQFIVEGFRFVIEALQSTFEVSMIFISEKALDKWKNFQIESRLKSDIKVYWVTDKILKTLSDTDTPQGIIAIVNNKNVEIRDKKGFYVLVDKVQDPGNMGTIIRTAHASGALGVIYTKGTVDIFNEKTLRSTMGSIFHVPLIEDSNNQNIKLLKDRGFKLIISSLKAEKNFYSLDLKDKIIISVGNEGKGISEEIDDLADIQIKIPMIGNAESLNAAVAASIMMFEVVRQKLL